MAKAAPQQPAAPPPAKKAKTDPPPWQSKGAASHEEKSDFVNHVNSLDAVSTVKHTESVEVLINQDKLADLVESIEASGKDADVVDQAIEEIMELSKKAAGTYVLIEHNKVGSPIFKQVIGSDEVNEFGMPRVEGLFLFEDYYDSADVPSGWYISTAYDLDLGRNLKRGESRLGKILSYAAAGADFPQVWHVPYWWKKGSKTEAISVVPTLQHIAAENDKLKADLEAANLAGHPRTPGASGTAPSPRDHGGHGGWMPKAAQVFAAVLDGDLQLAQDKARYYVHNSGPCFWEPRR